MDKAKILIVDDESEFVSEMQARLESCNYRVAVAGNRQVAQEMVSRERPDLVVLGTIGLRGDAFVFHRWLRRSSHCRDIPLIVVDAPPETHLLKGWKRHEGMQLESEDYVRRPISPTALLSAIENLRERLTRRIKVLVVDDHTVVRQGIHALLSLQRDMQVVGEAGDGREALQKLPHLQPDVVLMDIVMPGMGGLETTAEISKRYGGVKVLMVSQYDEEENVARSRKVGAFGFIPKKSASTELLLAGIRAAYRGEHLEKVAA